MKGSDGLFHSASREVPVLRFKGGVAGDGEFSGRKVAVVGLGISNLAVVRFLLRQGARITIYDGKGPKELGNRYRDLADSGVRWRLGPDYLAALVTDGPYDDLFLTPGMRKDYPELAAARKAGARVESEIGLFLRLCGAPIVGITGSAGKTTSTSLVGGILATTGRRVLVGGNIGQPVLSWANDFGPDDLAVLEFSSFQLQMLTASPNVAVYLNLKPNHLDIHSSFEEYAEAKNNILRFQSHDDVAVLNADDPLVVRTAGLTPARVFLFSMEREVEAGAFLRDGRVVLRGLADGPGAEIICGSAEEIPLPGRHNVANTLAALTAGVMMGADPAKAWQIVRRFRGVEHRLELVAELNGVRYYNDSVATAPDRTEAALNSFEEQVILIAGGYDKKIPFNGLGERILDGVRVLILLGDTAPRIRSAVEEAASRHGVSAPLVIGAGSLAEAVTQAAALARSGDVVLLSPACASFDMFSNYQERGRLFKKLVCDRLK